MMKTLGMTIAAAVAIVGGGLALGGATVDARSSEPIIRTGACTAGSDWKLKAKVEDAGKLEVEFEVDQNVTGATWHVVLRNDGVKFFEGDRKTMAPSGSFEVERLSTDGAGPDRILGRARNVATGEVCVGALTI